jgi:HEAT repeat protein
MLLDRDPGVRGVAAWALAHTGDMDVVPLLIETVGAANEDEDVVGAARLGLQILSRKIVGLGPPSPSTPEQRKSAARKWHDWYNTIRPLDLDDHDEHPAAPAGPGSPAPASSGSPAPASRGRAAPAPSPERSSTP